ncbi:DUF397 domain-containing protein [Streptomyces sp. NPDC050509]|uniref:DUF397 domain-containing protein n=1 Tax=Streptomyces sp. NPDC050509 TaxID=3365620 RepID=UPI0037ADC0E7
MSAGLKLVTAEWIRSSYSDANGGQCVEFSRSFAPAPVGGIVPVRDSKAPEGAPLVFPVGAFASFVAAVQAGTFGSG